MGFGNTFDAKSIIPGHAKKVWREVKDQYPAGGTITNISAFVEAGKVPAGSPVKFDVENKTIEVILDSAVSSAADAAAVAALGINGYLLYDTNVTDANTVGTNTVVYAGEIYEYMFDADVVAKLKLNTLTPMIVWVQ